jgi:hypothetical protein
LDGGVADGGPSFSRCLGFDIENSGVLDLDLRAVHIAGRVTLAGGVLPDEDGNRGKLVFEDAMQGARATVDLGSAGPSTYALTLPPGRYDVAFVGNAALCGGTTTPQVPCGGGTLRSALDLRSDGVLDIDIPVARVSGKVTLKGAPFPDEASERGLLQFKGQGGALAVSKAFGASGAVSYSLTLLPGKYDVAFAGNPMLCQGMQPSHVPCNAGIVARGVEIGSGVLDVDVGAVRVTGRVTATGAELADELQNRGQLSFSMHGETPVPTRAFGTTGPVSYSVTLLPGVYDVGFVGNSMLCGGDTASHVPCNGGTILKAANLAVDGNLDVNLSPVTVSGKVTLNGGPFPSESGDRGSLQFVGPDVIAASTKAFGTSGAASYQLTLLSGEYAVFYVPNPSLCAANAPAPHVPCVGGPLLAARPLTANGVLDVDVRSVRVNGVVTVNSARPDDETAARGQLTFSLTGGTSFTTPPFDATGPVSYGVTLLPGSYAVRFVANPMLCGRPVLAHIPCVSGTLLPRVSLDADGVLDVDVPAKTITGVVTLLHAPLPAESRNRGSISFAVLDQAGTNAAVAADLNLMGPGAYGITILPGRYVVSHQANAALCGPGLMPSVPCASQAIVGCE